MSTGQFCVADSGGTSTTWIYCRDGHRTVHRTEGLPPRSVFHSEEYFGNAVRNLPKSFAGKLHFYGTGLANPSNAEKMRKVLDKLGFSDVEINSDALGACRAALGNNPGTVAILGTGSVVMEYDGSQITEFRGGLGPFLGDEGSGYYFGRLVLHDFYNGFFDEEKNSHVERALGDHDNKTYLADTSAPAIISGIAAMLGQDDFREYHQRNFEEFIRVHFVRRAPSDRTLHIVGGYGEANQELLQDLLERKNWILGNVISNPAEKLCDFHSFEFEKKWNAK